jgi:hypothetical protein
VIKAKNASKKTCSENHPGCKTPCQAPEDDFLARQWVKNFSMFE